jgi:hypothetical protein
MGIKMKILDYRLLKALSESSQRANRKQFLTAEKLPLESGKQYIVNFHFDHQVKDTYDVRMSVVTKPGVETVWLDVSEEEFTAIPEIELSEPEWEAAVCVGIPRWVE